MTEVWQNLLVELIILAALGLGYYFFQRNRILRFEANRIPYLYSQMLQVLLVLKNENLKQPLLDSLIIKLDDFINQTSEHDPKNDISEFMNSVECPSEVRVELNAIFEQI